MIKFFRKIRQKLLSENKFSKYLIYAVGEIVLVVIGILIALNVNNYNEKLKEEAKLIEILKEVHQELSQDIQECNQAINFYRLKDSLINVVMNKELTVENFKGRNGKRYAMVGSSILDLHINNNGFNLLMANNDKIPEKYHSLVESLKEIYIVDQEELNASYITLDDAVGNYFSYLFQNKDWFHELIYHSKLTDDAINFYVNDHYFKNHLAEYQLGAIGGYYQDLWNFRIHTEDIYNKLTGMLQLEDLVETDSTYYKLDLKDYEHFLGTFKDSTSTAIISVESDRLFYQWKDNKKVRLFPITKNSFITELDEVFNTISQDSTGMVIKYNGHLSTWKCSLIKVD